MIDGAYSSLPYWIEKYRGDSKAVLLRKWEPPKYLKVNGLLSIFFDDKLSFRSPLNVVSIIYVVIEATFLFFSRYAIEFMKNISVHSLEITASSSKK